MFKDVVDILERKLLFVVLNFLSFSDSPLSDDAE